jgi:Polyketide cyclase / dehydrase and lipid transport
MLNVILTIAGLAIASVLVYAATRPDTFRVARTATIAAAPERIHSLIEDLHAHEQWSPFVRKDPAMKKSYSGPERGVGSTFAFEGNNAVGTGRLSVTGTAPPRQVTMRLQMFKPMAGDNVVQFTLAPQSTDTTDVTWAISGHQPFVGKLMGLVFNMDKMIGREFEKGLADLKLLAESGTTDTHTRAPSTATGARDAA